MLRMLARRRGQLLLGSNADRVMFGISLPSDTVVNKVSAKVHMVATTVQAHTIAAFYGVEGWILPILDPEDNASFDTIWDQLVPKDTDVQTLDLDTGASDTAPFFEPGEADWGQLLDVGLRPKRIYQRLELLTYATAAKPLIGDTFATQWIPTDRFDIRLNKRFVVRQPSVMLFAVAMPSMTDTTATIQTALSETEWSQVKYMEHVLERAQMDLLGLTEAGAETPWEEATDLLQEHLEPDMAEDTAGVFDNVPFNVIHDARIDHSVVGRLGKMTVSTGR